MRWQSGGCGAPRAGAPLTSPAAAPGGGEAYVDARDGVRLYARVLGAARPDTIVVLHGRPDFSTTYFGEDLRTLADHHTARPVRPARRWPVHPRRRFRGVGARTLVLQGTADVFPPESAREWAAALPNARVLLLDGVGHFPYLEAPRRFNEAVSAFMAGGWPDGAVAGSGG